MLFPSPRAAVTRTHGTVRTEHCAKRRESRDGISVPTSYRLSVRRLRQFATSSHSDFIRCRVATERGESSRGDQIFCDFHNLLFNIAWLFRELSFFFFFCSLETLLCQLNLKLCQ
jgi:hypothetical protein